jgi:hypothetical protein
MSAIFPLQTVCADHIQMFFKHSFFFTPTSIWYTKIILLLKYFVLYANIVFL